MKNKTNKPKNFENRSREKNERIKETKEKNSKEESKMKSHKDFCIDLLILTNLR